MQDVNRRSPILERVDALRADAAQARDRAHQRAATADQLCKRAATARRDAELARHRAAQLFADLLSRPSATDFA